ncbi:MAG TPA: PqqD family protein [Coriobacteriia bacterium]|nr:PqqD family protein [Coriobacteriia bacterium]
MSHDVPNRADGSAWRMVDGEMIVVSATTANILSLNGTGAFVWERLDGEKSIGAIAAELAEAYEVSRDEAEEHVSEFLGSLHDEGLVKYEREASAR